MASKKNSLKLLSWLYFKQSLRTTGVATDTGLQPALLASDLGYFFPELSSGGQRSLISLLVSESLVERIPYSPGMASTLHLPAVSQENSNSIVITTNNGVDLLNRQFPVFKNIHEPWKGEWTIIAFLEAPKSDPQFRYLRSRLLAAQASQIKAGLYVYPGDLPNELFVQLKELYVGSVVLWQTNKWRFGDERNIIGKNFDLHSTLQALSGVSRDIEKLLVGVDAKKGLTGKQKKKLFMVFDRFYHIISQDAGIFSWYFPREKTVSQILYAFHDAYAV